MPSATLSKELLQRQDDLCSTSVIEFLSNEPAFTKLAEFEGNLIMQRDHEDGEKLSKGIQISVKKGILPPTCEVAPVRPVRVIGMTADEVAAAILKQLPKQEGNVIVLQGLSGTGKGTTVQKLKGLLPKCVTWSNGNVFRCYTYLVSEALKAKGLPLSTEVLEKHPEIIAAAVPRVTYDEVSTGVYDVFIDKKQRVSEIATTLLQSPLINSSVPVVAEQTQGEVICFGQRAVKTLSDAGYNVILEGRSQTLSYIPSKERFELVIPETSLLGQRRAAQRVVGRAVNLLQEKPDLAPQEAVLAAVKALQEAL